MKTVSLFALCLALLSCDKATPKGQADQAMQKTSSAISGMSSASLELQQNLSAAEEGCKMDAPCGASSSSQP